MCPLAHSLAVVGGAAVVVLNELAPNVNKYASVEESTPILAFSTSVREVCSSVSSPAVLMRTMAVQERQW